MSGGRQAANTDPRSQPAYPQTEGAKYLRLPVATLRAWNRSWTQGADHAGGGNSGPVVSDPNAARERASPAELGTN